MTTIGFIFMMVSVIGVVALCGYCLWKVLTLPPPEVEENLHGHAGIEPHDIKNPE